MSNLYKNTETKVVFVSDDAQSSPVEPIQAEDVDGLKVQGYTVTPAVESFLASTSAGDTQVTSGTDTASSQDQATVTPSLAASNETDATPDSSAVTDKTAAEQAEADAGVDTTKDVGTVTLTPDNLGSVTGQPVTPDGTPVVEAQPEAVTVKGPEYPANSPVVAASGDAANDTAGFDDLDHKGVLERLLGELEGIAAMGKAEIQAVLVRARNAVEKL